MPDLYDESWSKDAIHPTYVYANGRYVGRNVWRQQELLDRLQRFKQLNRILDVGCSAAFFLKLAKDRGWNVQGVEIAEWAATFSREELGVPVGRMLMLGWGLFRLYRFVFGKIYPDLEHTGLHA